MAIYVLWSIFGLTFIFVELIAPAMFFLNLSAAAFLTAVYAWLFPKNYDIQIIIFCVLALAFILFLRPLMLKKQDKYLETGINEKYIGHEALVSRTIGTVGTDGVGQVKIYDEVWQAKDIDMGQIPAFSMVKIVRIDGTVMFVRKIEKEETPKNEENDEGSSHFEPDNNEKGED